MRDNFPVYNQHLGGVQSPYELARKIYQQEPCARTFREDLEQHLRTGYVWSSPRTFIMGRPVRRSGDRADIVTPHVTFDNPDCWHIYLAAGELYEFFRLEPFELPWFSWERHNVLRFYRRERVIQLCLHFARQLR